MKCMINVVNLKNTFDCNFICDRRSLVGNPFIMSGKSNRERDRVCNEYFNKYYNITNNTWNWSSEQLEFLNSIVNFYNINGEVSIGCWCSPKRCHCDTIKLYLEQQVGINNLNGLYK